VKQESGFSIGARSPVGAFGLTQVMPDTAKDLGIYPAYYDDPMLQLDGGARYFLTQLNTFGSVPLALAAYNAGPGNVTKYGGIPPFEETQDYVVRITGFFNAYAGKISGVDQVGTFDPRDMAIAEASNTPTRACTMAWPPPRDRGLAEAAAFHHRAHPNDQIDQGGAGPQQLCPGRSRADRAHGRAGQGSPREGRSGPLCPLAAGLCHRRNIHQSEGWFRMIRNLVRGFGPLLISAPCFPRPLPSRRACRRLT
jgi:hypothetical protein